MAYKHSNSSFTDIVADARIEYIDSFLKEIDNIIDFNKLRPILKKNGIGNKNVCGVTFEGQVLGINPCRVFLAHISFLNLSHFTQFTIKHS